MFHRHIIPAPAPVFLALVFLALVSMALTSPVAGQKAKPQADVLDEIIVTAPRNGEPDFQEANEFHQKEFQRLHAKFGKEPPAQARGDQVFSTGGPMTGPNDRSATRDQIQNAPRLRDTFSDK